MKTSTRQDIFEYVTQERQASPAELAKEFQLSGVMVHRHLQQLLKDGQVMKLGQPPRVWYVPSNSSPERESGQTKVTRTVANLAPEIVQLLEGTYVYLQPNGVFLKGVAGFLTWAEKTQPEVNVQTLAQEYQEYRRKAETFRAQLGWITATPKLKEVFGKQPWVDELYYQDFYALPKFGKTRLGQLVLHAKLAQHTPLIKTIGAEIQATVQKLITEKQIEIVGFIPPSLPRKVQFLTVLREALQVNLPELKLFKAYPDLVLAQKSLSKLTERVENAKGTILLDVPMALNLTGKRVLLIDDAVGSGATFVETARKLKQQRGVAFVAGYAVVGSYKGFEVIKEV